MERRDFFSELLVETAKKLKIDKILNAPVTWNAEALLQRLQSDETYRREMLAQCVVRTGEAVTLRGEPFGAFVQDIRLQEFPDPLGDRAKTVLEIACDHRDAGRSTFEWMDKRHIVSSYRNERLDAPSVEALAQAGIEVPSTERERADGSVAGYSILIRVSESGAFAVLGLVAANGESFISVL